MQGVVKDLTNFQENPGSDSVLVFPSTSSFHRFLIHKEVEGNYPALVSFSVGQGKHRRLVVSKTTTLHRHIEQCSSPPQGLTGATLQIQTKLLMDLEKKNAGDMLKSKEHILESNLDKDVPLCSPASEAAVSRGARQRKERRPDIALYVPRARRQLQDDTQDTGTVQDTSNVAARPTNAEVRSARIQENSLRQHKTKVHHDNRSEDKTLRSTKKRQSHNQNNVQETNGSLPTHNMHTGRNIKLKKTYADHSSQLKHEPCSSGHIEEKTYNCEEIKRCDKEYYCSRRKSSHSTRGKKPKEQGTGSTPADTSAFGYRNNSRKSCPTTTDIAIEALPAEQNIIEHGDFSGTNSFRDATRQGAKHKDDFSQSNQRRPTYETEKSVGVKNQISVPISTYVSQQEAGSDENLRRLLQDDENDVGKTCCQAEDTGEFADDLNKESGGSEGKEAQELDTCGNTQQPDLSVEATDSQMFQDVQISNSEKQSEELQNSQHISAVLISCDQEDSLANLDILHNADMNKNNHASLDLDKINISQQDKKVLRSNEPVSFENDLEHNQLTDSGRYEPISQVQHQPEQCSNVTKDQEVFSSFEKNTTCEIASKSEDFENQTNDVKRSCSSELPVLINEQNNTKSTAVNNSTPLQPSSSDDQEGSWDAMFDDNGEVLDETAMLELSAAVGKVKVKATQFTFYQIEPPEIHIDDDAYSHLIEIYDFPKSFQTADLVMIFKEYKDKGFDIKWVDDTHAIGVFGSAIAAGSALQLQHPMVKVRAISQATQVTKVKVRRIPDLLQPYKPRPQTVPSVARNMVANALGLRTNVPKEKRDEERRKLKEAKDRKRQQRQQKDKAWDGTYGKCAMDDT